MHFFKNSAVHIKRFGRGALFPIDFFAPAYVLPYRGKYFAVFKLKRLVQPFFNAYKAARVFSRGCGKIKAYFAGFRIILKKRYFAGVLAVQGGGNTRTPYGLGGGIERIYAVFINIYLTVDKAGVGVRFTVG